MIRQIKGKLIEIERRKKDNLALLELQGIVYEIYLPSGIVALVEQELARSRRENKDCVLTLQTIHYLEGSMSGGPMVPRLIGFTDPMDREFFEIFTTVNGLGVRTALKSMVCPVSDIARAIEKEDATWLDNLPEIGASTAKKIIAELKGKVAKFALGKSSSTFPEDTEPLQPSSVAPDMKEESMAVLLQLQYSRIEAESMIQKALQRNKKISNSEDLVAEIFRQQSSR